MCWTLLLSTLLLSPNLASAKMFPTRETTDKWAGAIDERFVRITSGDTDITGGSLFQKQYQSWLDASDVRIEHADGAEIVAKFAEDVENTFKRAKKAVKNLKSAVERTMADYSYRYDLRLSDVNYTNANQISEDEFELDERFGRKVDHNSSAVHIPIEIYEGWLVDRLRQWWKDPDILNAITWTSALDSAFKANVEENPDLFWQSFGSKEGILRFYPASKWETLPEVPDLFDVRRRAWYIHGSVADKKVVILLDTSGSMHGQSFEIMKLAAKALLDTLGESDLVNVAAFSRNASWVTPCLDGLVEANSRNKKLLFAGIDRLRDHGIARYDKALEFASSALASASPRCHELVLMFSDGGTEYPAPMMETLVNGSQTRIFTFAVGPHPLPTGALRNMACRSGARFETITAMGAIRTKMQAYLELLAEEQEIGIATSPVHDDNMAYTSHLRRLERNDTDEGEFDTIFFNNDHLGLGPVTTVTSSVFNSSFAGVVAVDVPNFQLTKLLPRSKLGPLGYGLAVNPKGHVLIHPRLDQLTKDSSKESTNAFNLDFIEAESPANLLKISGIRNRLIDKPESPEKVEIDEPYDNVAGPLRGTREYHFQGVQNVPIAVGVALDEDWNHLAQLPSGPMSAFSALNKQWAMAAPWEYCDEDQKLSRVPDTNASEVLPNLLKRISEGTCSGERLSHLAWDASLLSDIFNDIKGSDQASINARFVLSDGGLMLFHPPSLHKYMEDLGSPYNASLFRQAVSYRAPQIVMERVEPNLDLEPSSSPFKSSSWSSLDTEETVSDVRLWLSLPLVVSSAGMDYVAGVSGVQLSAHFIQRLLVDHARELSLKELDCSDHAELLCYLLDHRGRIVSSNQNFELIPIGEFLGHVDPQLMSHFKDKLDKELYSITESTNYDDLCENEVDCRALGIKSFVVPTLNSILYVVHYALNSVQSLLGAAIMSFLLRGTDAIMAEFGAGQTGPPEGLHHCTSTTLNFALNADLKSTQEFHDRLSLVCSEQKTVFEEQFEQNDEIVVSDLEKQRNSYDDEELEESRCTRDFHVYKLAHMNLVLAVVENMCDKCQVPIITDQPVEIKETRESCHMPERYSNAGPVHCDKDQREKVSRLDCSKGTELRHMSLMLTLAVVAMQTLAPYVILVMA